ncbi:FUSC family protein [Pseudomonas gingeri]|uniref:FUSC family protein n=1 Tax=Pseudomonas gingeri TaxID=117681 RepID=A0A7Y8C0T4_9PSED|nr:FUSC family protein [Pseudomonas gingeri]NWB95760.1 FUSC family protein [Pseudomonas gingeri]
MNKRSLIFGFNCYVASLAALLVAFSFDLPNPWWAVITVFLTSQPSIEGAIWAKALFRLGGTMIGLVAALLIIPNLVDAPELMLIALATWLALCVFTSLQDRTPRSYLPLLAGYGAILVGLPVIDNPANIFTTAVARTEEILIGVLCASIVHALMFPRSVHAVLRTKVDDSMAVARIAILKVMRGEATSTDEAERLHFASSAIDIALQASVLGFEPPRGQSRARVAKALSERLAALLPLICAVDDRKHALSTHRPSAPARGVLAATVHWMENDDFSPESFHALVNELRTALPAAASESSWSELVEISLVERVCWLVEVWHECMQLAAALAQPNQSLSPTVRRLTATTPLLSLHIDQGIALWSAFNAALAVLVFGGLAMLIQWPPATVGIGIAAVLTSLFASLDDPTPLMQKMLTWTLISIPVGAIYVFAILPAIDGFVLLAIVLFPVIAIPAALMTVPRHALRALSLLLVTTTVIGIQSAYHADLEAFANLSISASLGTAIALALTRIIRVIETQFVARRIVRAGWRDLKRLTRRSPSSIIPFAMRMLDRVGLLLPRLPPASQVAANSLRELRIGVSLNELMSIAPLIDSDGGHHLANLRKELGMHFDSLARHPESTPPPPLTKAIDALRPTVLGISPYRQRLRAIAAWVGLRSAFLPGNEHE